MVYNKRNILSAITLFFVSSVIFLFITACEGIFPVPEPITYTITASTGNNGSIDPEGKTIVSEGEDQTFTIIPDEGYELEDVLVDGGSVDTVSEYTFTDVKQDHTIQVSFLKKPQPVLPITTKKYTITATSGIGGTIEPEGNVKINKGDDQAFTITADDGYQIIDIKVDGTSLDNIDPTDTYIYTFTDIQANHTIESSFIRQFTIKASAGDNGSIQPKGEISVLKGESQTFTITPDICYQIEKIIINETEEVEAGSPYTIDDIQEDYSIEVSFTLSDKKIRRYNQDGEIQQDDYTSIHAAINDEDTIDGDTIIVCPGTYRENLEFNGKNITVKSADPSNPDIVAATIINGDIDGDGSGDGSVVTFINGDTSALFGFTVQNGTGTLMNTYTAGGGIYIDSSNPNILNNIIENNASANGGGIFIAGDSSPEIEKNIIRDNESTNMAGGIYIFKCSPNITDNTISGNLTNTYGGGIYVFEGYKESLNNIAYNVIENNKANNGGGIYLSNASPRLVNNDIKNNNANNYGGGLYIETCSPDITENNFISGNSAANGGGIYINNSYNSTTENSINGNSITKNMAISAGGGIYINNSMPTIEGNNIISENGAQWGGGIYIVSSSPEITNNLSVNENSAQYGGGIFVGNGSRPDIKKNNIKNNVAKEENGGGGIFVHTNANSPNIGGTDSQDIESFNIICGNKSDQIAPDEYEFNYISNECNDIK